MKIYKNKNECCGCMACVDMCPKNAIEPIKDRKGFYYPTINKEKCINCGLCQKICFFKKEYKVEDYSKRVYAVKNKDYEARMKSSSGGVYSAISDYILNQGGVVYGAAFISKDKCAHIRCANIKERDRTRGSKYVQSDMVESYKQIRKDLETGRSVLFTGTPCQTAAVRSIFSEFSDKLYLVDVICHGVPSPGMFEEHIECCEKRKKKTVREFVFRPKIGDGRNQTPAIIYEDGEIDSTSRYIRIYSDLFNEGKILRNSCFECQFSSPKRTGDITIGDFWGIEKIAPKFVDSDGISAVIINSEKGERLYEAIKEKLQDIESTFDDVAKKNYNLRRPTHKPKYSFFYFVYQLMGYDKAIKQYTDNTILKRIKMKIAWIIK